MTEIALLTPMLLFLALGVSDLGRGFFYKEGVSNSARQAVRLAAQDQAAGNLACGGGGTVTRAVPDPGTDAVSRIVNTAALENTTDGRASGSFLRNPAAPTTMVLTWHCNGASPFNNTTSTTVGGCDPSSPRAPCADSIEVTLDYSFKLITPLIGGAFPAQTVHIRTDELGRLEY